MQYIQLRQAFNDFTVFTLNDIRQIDPNFHRRRLNDWQAKGYIKKAIKEFYIFSDKHLDENVLFEIANRIYKPSYISFEMALSFYQFIPEIVYSMTSASTRRTYVFHTLFGDFQYRTIKPALFFGYEIIPYNSKIFKIAEPEKAILDYLYINAHLKTGTDFESLRINEEIFFQKIDLDKLTAYCQKFQNKMLIKRMSRFIKFLTSQRNRNNA